MSDLSLRERLAELPYTNEKDADAQIAVFLSYLSDNGLAIVPVESTPEMYAAGDEVGLFRRPDADEVYGAMVKAAPPAAELLEKGAGE